MCVYIGTRQTILSVSRYYKITVTHVDRGYKTKDIGYHINSFVLEVFEKRLQQLGFRTRPFYIPPGPDKVLLSFIISPIFYPIVIFLCLKYYRFPSLHSLFYYHLNIILGVRCLILFIGTQV